MNGINTSESAIATEAEKLDINVLAIVEVKAFITVLQVKK
jgi:hypothetical protein